MVSPIVTAATIESASSARAPAEIEANGAIPRVPSTQATRSAPPTLERSAFTATDPRSAIRDRTRRPVTAQVTAEPRAASAPSVVSASTRR